MGPRLFRRGNSKKRHILKERRLLQWGHVFSDVEILLYHRHYGYALPASMGPRLFRRGNEVVKNPSPSSSTASMGPRLFRRGNSARAGSLPVALLNSIFEHSEKKVNPVSPKASAAKRKRPPERVERFPGFRRHLASRKEIFQLSKTFRSRRPHAPPERRPSPPP